jgi:hypothetical protein
MNRPRASGWLCTELAKVSSGGTQLEVARGKEFCKAACRIKNTDALRKHRPGRGTQRGGDFCKRTVTDCLPWGGGPVGIALWTMAWWRSGSMSPKGDVVGSHSAGFHSCHLDSGYAFMALVRFIAIISVVICFLLAPQLGKNARAIAQLVSIDIPITSENMERLKKYFDGIDITKAKTFSREFEGLTIIRVESDTSCLNDKCLTIVIRNCDRDVCPNVKLLVGRDVFSNPLYVEVFGGLRSVAFGRPGNTSTVIIFGDALMLVATGP